MGPPATIFMPQGYYLEMKRDLIVVARRVDGLGSIFFAIPPDPEKIGTVVVHPESDYPEMAAALAKEVDAYDLNGALAYYANLPSWPAAQGAKMQESQ